MATFCGGAMLCCNTLITILIHHVAPCSPTADWSNTMPPVIWIYHRDRPPHPTVVGHSWRQSCHRPLEWGSGQGAPRRSAATQVWAWGSSQKHHHCRLVWVMSYLLSIFTKDVSSLNRIGKVMRDYCLTVFVIVPSQPFLGAMLVFREGIWNHQLGVVSSWASFSWASSLLSAPDDIDGSIFSRPLDSIFHLGKIDPEPPLGSPFLGESMWEGGIHPQNQSVSHEPLAKVPRSREKIYGPIRKNIHCAENHTCLISYLPPK